MKNKGFTLVETMVVAGISLGIAAVIFSIFIIMNVGLAKTNAYANLKQQSQAAIDTIQNYLEKASPDTVTITACQPGQCLGDRITFQVPIINNDAIAGTLFSPTGQPKLGAYYNNGQFTYTVRDGYFDIYADANNNLVAEVWDWHDEDEDPPGCFLAGTPVLMADGSQKPIEQIKPGDKVLAFNEKTGKNEKNTVAKLLIHKVKRYLIINGNLKVTPEHRFYHEGKWVNIGSLKVGDKLLNFKGQQEEIVSIEKVNQKVTVYNFVVNPSHTYFAGGFLVHNAKLPFKIEGDEGVKLFQDIFGVKEAFAAIIRRSLNTKIITSKRVTQANFAADADKGIINVSLTLEVPKSGLIGETIVTTTSEIAPLNP